MTENIYNERYESEDYYWGREPSSIAAKLVDLLPSEPRLKALDIGCGEGRDAVFLAKAGLDVTAFDISQVGLEKAHRWAGESGVALKLVCADINEHRLDEDYDILLSSGVLHYIPEELRDEIFANYRAHTRPGGLHAFATLLDDPSIPPAPDAEPSAHLWRPGGLVTRYTDWAIEFHDEIVFDCNSGGVPHQHALGRLIARKPAS